MDRRWAPVADPKLAEARLRLEKRVNAQMEAALKDCKTPLAKASCREAYGRMLHQLEDILCQQHGHPPANYAARA